SLDWLIRPVARVDFSGVFFSGENVGVIGGLRQGVTIEHGRPATAVEAMGGWGQLKFVLTPRLSLHAFAGEEQDRASHLNPGAIGKNQMYGANLIYRIGSNILTGFELSQARTTYVNSATRLNPHYDLAIGYLF